MRIAKIELVNCKSVETAVLETQGDVIVILGKNGSGKSNILNIVHEALTAKNFNDLERTEFIREGSTHATVKLTFDDFFIERIFDADKDTYMLNGRQITHEEVRGYLEAKNMFSNQSTYVKQSEIHNLPFYSSSERMGFIEEITGLESFKKNCENVEKVLADAISGMKVVYQHIKKLGSTLKKLEAEKARHDEYMEVAAKRNEYLHVLYHLKIAECEEIHAQTEDASKKNQLILEDLISQQSIIEASISGTYSEGASILKESLKKRMDNLNAYIDKSNAELSSAISELHIIEKQLCIARALEGKSKHKISEYKQKLRGVICVDKDNSIANTDVQSRKDRWIERQRLLEQNIELEQGARRLRKQLGVVDIEKYFQNYGGDMLGYVYDLLDIPDNIMGLLNSKLLHIVVKDETSATRLALVCLNMGFTHSVTFIPLNILRYTKLNDIEEFPALSSLVRCKEKYAPLLNYLCEDTYLVSDYKSAVRISRKHSVSCVTPENEMCFKSGVIYGGYREQTTASYLSKLSDTIRILKKNKVTLSEIDDNDTPGLEIPMIDKIGYSNIDKIFECVDLQKVSEKLLMTNFKKDRIQKSLADWMSQRNDVLQKLDNIGRIIQNNELLKKLDDVKQKIAKLRIGDHNSDDDIQKKIDNSRVQELYRGLESTGVCGTRCADILCDDKHRLIRNIQETDTKLSRMLVNKKVGLIYDKTLVEKEKLLKFGGEIEDSVVSVRRLLSELYQKISTILNVNITLTLQNFNLFISKFQNFIVKSMRYEGDRIDIIDWAGHVIDDNNLSGGQKTVIGIVFLFSVLRMNPSTFYILDEIDSNLDTETRQVVSGIIRTLSKNNSQFLVSTFREEMINIGDIHFNAQCESGCTTVTSIEKGQIEEIISIII